ncbi:hypothetical protein GWK47_055077 [Chionoecetes opilio]|uniref:DDE Tnp4 domain-containing protein n=1 Tax=Chionoecetes opilio TaxID=41210 RepID=A0A8J5C606_CHIOP|nr:hypothetical protein GWK47_055077 [Chionoecetes opilio]
MNVSFSGDGGYPLMPFLMVPYKQPETLSEHRFNKGHTSTRVVVEQAFGVLKLSVIFAESLEVLVMALEALHEEAKLLGLEVSGLKTKVQVFEGLIDETVQSVHACGEDIEISESFTYLGSAVQNDGGSRQEVLQRIGIAHGLEAEDNEDIGDVYVPVDADLESGRIVREELRRTSFS